MNVIDYTFKPWTSLGKRDGQNLKIISILALSMKYYNFLQLPILTYVVPTLTTLIHDNSVFPVESIFL